MEQKQLLEYMEREELFDVFSLDKYDIKTLSNVEPMKRNIIIQQN